MVIYELLIVIVILWIFVIIINKDLFSPSSLLCLSYIFAVICAIYNIDNWKINLHYNTFFVIVIGIISFLLSSFIFKSLYREKKEEGKSKLNYIEIKQYKLIFLDIISFIIFAIYTFYFIKALGGFSALGNFSVAMEIYRGKTLLHDMILIPGWINFLTKVCRAIAYIYTYIVVNNIIVRKKENIMHKQENKMLYLIGIILYLPLTLMSGGRYDLIVYMIFVLIIWSIMYAIENSKKMQPKKIVKIGLIVIILLVAFSNFRGLVGRTNKSSTIDYVTEYFGGSIEIFDMYMQDHNHGSKYFGQETFAGVRKFLYQIKLLDNQRVSEEATEFRTIYNGKTIGNVYTGFRKMYQDFGMTGVVILQALMAIIFNKLYYDCFYKKENSKIHKSILLSGCIAFCLVLHSYSESFYSTVISFNYIVFFIIMMFISRFLLKIEIRRR